jgi:hypothetical protein
VLTTVTATRDSAGKVLKVSRKLFGVSGEGLKLKANHRYRVIGEYDNPTNETLVRGAMAHMSGIFSPDDMSKWPAIDPSNPDYQRDLVSLQVRGTGEAAAENHGGHDMHGGPDMNMEHDHDASAPADPQQHEGHTAH